ncbi:hypothetical protein TruAng_003367 [Truncatella angustata]|nr:hypothetical protein TruAng_003367 [Truncatella angustata]
MPPSARRSSQRTRKARDPSPDPVHEQSSPSRPSKRRRKVQPDPPSEPADDEDSTLTVADSDEVLISKVAQCLATIPGTQASRDHANSLQDPSGGDISAYAKIAAQEWTYFVKHLVVNIGRTTEVTSGHSIPTDPNDEDFVHIDLGPTKVFSRQTAQIYFDADTDPNGSWYLKVKGRNGLKVNGDTLKRENGPHPLSSGEVIEVGGIEMMFVLPANLGPLKVHDIYTSRIGNGPPLLNSKPQRSSPVAENRSLPLPVPEAIHHKGGSRGSATAAAAAAGTASPGPAFHQPIAPAPTDYRRPGTPPSAVRGRASASHHRSPAYGTGGTMLINSNSDVDLSLDDNQHVKPQFSYAQMITQAIISTEDHKLNLNGIYRYIMENFAYYRHAAAGGWQNSIRHNLSLNKSFAKMPRSTDEPGKGMKWEIVPEQKEDMINNAYKTGRGGHRGSSAPSSPNAPGQLNYVNHGPREMAGRGPGSARKRKLSPIASPPPTSSVNPTQTPVSRSRYDANGLASFQDGSPLPRPRKPLTASSSFATEGLNPRSPPTLSSSYLQDESAPFVTPAPQKLHPRLAPPSTAQRPSQHMPTSSPAPFWKYADIGSTPLRLPFDPSPSKPALPGSSSPPPPADGSRSPIASPSRSTVRSETPHVKSEPAIAMPDEEDEDEEVGFDLTKGFQSIGSYHAPIGRGLGVPKANGR